MTDKLVRDKRPVEMLINGVLPIIRRAQNHEKKSYAWDKLKEEYDELRAAEVEDLAEELADVAEVLMLLAELYDIDLFEAVQQKRDLYGGFSEGFIWEGNYDKDTLSRHRKDPK